MNTKLWLLHSVEVMPVIVIVVIVVVSILLSVESSVSNARVSTIELLLLPMLRTSVAIATRMISGIPVSRVV